MSDANLAKDFSYAVRLHGEGRYAEAEELYRRLLDRLPDNVNLLVNYGLLLRERQRHAEALAMLRRAVNLSPANHGAWLALGAACESAGRLQEALAAFDRAVTLAPHDPRGWNNQGKALYLLGRPDEALASFQRAVRLRPDYPLALANLGVALHALERFAEAVACLERAASMRPQDTDVLYNLASALALAGRREDAVARFRQILRLDANHAPARHMLAALTGATPDAAAPRDYVRMVFDQYAARFEAHITGVLGYTAPTALRRLADTIARRRFARAVDLGCGTGLAGLAFRDTVEQLWGVDLSAAMLAEARAKGIYDRLEQEEIVAFLHACRQEAWRFDLLLAADVLIYQGGLEPLFGAAVACLAPDGLFLFSVETLDRHGKGAGFMLRPSGRFAHHPDYVAACARRCGLRVLARRPIRLRKEQGVWLDGLVCALGRPSAAIAA